MLFVFYGFYWFCQALHKNGRSAPSCFETAEKAAAAGIAPSRSRLCFNLLCAKSLYHYLLKSDLIRFFALLECGGTSAEGEGSISYTEMIRPALEFMVENYREPISVEMLAELVHLSKSYFMSCFKKAAGIGAIEYLAQLRINAACRMLTDTTASISDIAYHCGYNNLSNFNRYL